MTEKKFVKSYPDYKNEKENLAVWLTTTRNGKASLRIFLDDKRVTAYSTS